MTSVPDYLPSPRRQWASLSIAIALLVTVLDAAMVVVLLPLIAETYQVDPSVVIWVMTAYQLTMACLVLQTAAVSERFGHWRVFCSGLALFGAASLFCAFATSLPQLIAGRILQGLGAAAVHAIAMALTRLSHPRERFGRAAGINSSVVGISMAAGPSVCALILTFTDWRGVFLVATPIVLVELVVGVAALPRTSPNRHPLDLVSAVLLAAAMVGFILTLGELGEGTNLLVLAAGAIVTATLFTILIRRQMGRTKPIFPVDLLASKPIALTTAANMCVFAAQALTFVSLTFHLRHVTDLSISMIGLLITPWPVGVALMGAAAGRLSDSYSPQVLCTIGTGFMLAGILSMQVLPEAITPFDIAWRMFLCGLGFGLFNTPNNRTAILTAPPDRTTAAAALLATCRLTGQSIGTATASVAFSYWPQTGGIVGLGCAAAIIGLATVLSALKRKA